MPNQNPNQNMNTADRILEELITSRGETNRVLAQQQEQIIQLMETLKSGPPQSTKRKEQIQNLVLNFRKTNR